MHATFASSLVEWDSLLQAVLGGLAASSVLTVVLSLLMRGLIRGGEHRRHGQHVRVVGDYALATLAALVLLAAIVLAMVIVLGNRV